MTDPGRLVAQHLVRGERGGQRREEVQFDDPGVAFGGGLAEEAVRRTSGVVDQAVQPAVRRRDLREEGPYGGRVAQVEGAEVRGAARRGHGGVRRPPGADHHLRASLQKRTGDTRTDAPGAAGDDGDPSRQIEGQAHSAPLPQRAIRC